nr:hypothetical protein BgiMline_008268 [Biomphalaria glabrata]
MFINRRSSASRRGNDEEVTWLTTRNGHNAVSRKVQSEVKYNAVYIGFVSIFGVYRLTDRTVIARRESRDVMSYALHLNPPIPLVFPQQDENVRNFSYVKDGVGQWWQTNGNKNVNMSVSNAAVNVTLTSTE